MAVQKEAFRVRGRSYIELQRSPILLNEGVVGDLGPLEPRKLRIQRERFFLGSPDQPKNRDRFQIISKGGGRSLLISYSPLSQKQLRVSTIPNPTQRLLCHSSLQVICLPNALNAASPPLVKEATPSTSKTLDGLDSIIEGAERYSEPQGVPCASEYRLIQNALLAETSLALPERENLDFLFL